MNPFESQLAIALADKSDSLRQELLARCAGKPSASLEECAEHLADESALRARILELSSISQKGLALLSDGRWWPRATLVSTLALLAGDPQLDVGAAVNSVLVKFPVIVRDNPGLHGDDLSLFAPFCAAIEPLLAVHREVPFARLPAFDSSLPLDTLALVLMLGLVGQRRPRRTRGGELHSGDLQRLERVMPKAREMHFFWNSKGVFEEVDGGLVPIVPRLRGLLATDALSAEWVRSQLDSVGLALIAEAIPAPPGAALSLGATLAWLSVTHASRDDFNVHNLCSRVAREDLSYGDWLNVRFDRDTYQVASDVVRCLKARPFEISVPEKPTGYVQPNFEVVLPAHNDLWSAFVVASAAELTHFESVARLRITRESVGSARTLGFSGAEILVALEAISHPRPLPSSVRQAVLEWAEESAEARIRIAHLITVAGGEAICQRAENILRPLLVERPAVGFFVLASMPDADMLQELRALGIAVKSATATTTPGDEPPPRLRDLPSSQLRLTESEWVSRPLPKTLDPQQILTWIESSRSKKLSLSSSAYDPDERIDRPLPLAVSEALTDLQNEWSTRDDWIAQVRQIAITTSFRSLAAVQPGALALALRRSSDPNQLRAAVARLLAEQSARRANDFD